MEKERTAVVQRTDVVSSEPSSSQNKPCVPVTSICKWSQSVLGRKAEGAKGRRLVPKLPGAYQCPRWGRGFEIRRVSAGPSHWTLDKRKTPTKCPRGLVTSHTDCVQQTSGRDAAQAWKTQAQTSQDRAQVTPSSAGWGQLCHVETRAPAAQAQPRGPVGSHAQHRQASHF